ncbi:hypothetical protein AVEN_194873-1 [Araneus ventricosus]|uniref:Uncharacterized protein n=1 Tax=Araneus ventricosus TaxID=182803 RepID=A0A4Y2B2R6_ARAVE|nr:hypothetical protein AVEN_194873-1 [Araneus ventricosus]
MGRGGLVVKSKFQGQRVPGSKPDSAEHPPCMRARCPQSIHRDPNALGVVPTTHSIDPPLGLKLTGMDGVFYRPTALGVPRCRNGSGPGQTGQLPVAPNSGIVKLKIA